LAERLALSQRLLESGDQSICAIAVLAGFCSQVSLHQHFSKALGVSPSQYRGAFRGQGRARSGIAGAAQAPL
jgi:transcriptional regulator GlxA family with amidase domain